MTIKIANFIDTGYISAASGQKEVYAYVQTNDETITTIYTVPTGKTFYLTKIIVSDDDGNYMIYLYKGAVKVLQTSTGIEDKMVEINFPVPMKFESGDLIRVSQLDMEHDLNPTNSELNYSIFGFTE